VSPPFEAPYDLSAPIRAGTWHIIADGIVWTECDVTFDMLLRPGDGGPDVTIVSFTHHFVPGRNPDGSINFDAVAYEESAEGARVEAKAGDQLVWRHHVSGTTATIAWAPNGDGPTASGRYPSIDLPGFDTP
jgi:hypothetical protein